MFPSADLITAQLHALDLRQVGSSDVMLLAGPDLDPPAVEAPTQIANALGVRAADDLRQPQHDCLASPCRCVPALLSVEA